MVIKLGFSPCPNDTFIFDALVNNKINTGELKFEVFLEDVQTLNDMAIKNQLDVTKISYGVLPLLINNYTVLNSGSALGSGVGPLLISKEYLDPKEINNYTIAIPGQNTTAHLLFNLAFPNAKNKIFLRYDEIESFVLNSSDQKNLGVIIHENRFTYQDKGLIKIIDLGDFWEKTTSAPIPLGGIVAKNNMDRNLIKKVDSLIKESIQFSFSNYPVLSDYVKKHAQEMSVDVMRKHIDLYVNDFSIDLGEKGKNAIIQLLSYSNEPQKLTKESLFI